MAISDRELTVDKTVAKNNKARSLKQMLESLQTVKEKQHELEAKISQLNKKVE